MIELDGAYGEGGGQIIRTALALSTLTGKPFTAKNIRVGRDEPGLKAQHLACIKALEDLSLADARGAELSSTNLVFHPGKISPQTLSIDIGTAGSIPLLMQSLLLPCCLAEDKIRLKIKGGTDGLGAMSMDYFLNLLLPKFDAIADFKMNEMRRGYYPKGGGFLDITIKPKAKSMLPLDYATRLHIDKISGISTASSALRGAEVSERQARGAKKKLSSLNIPVRITEEYQDTESIGTIITLWTDKLTMGASAMGHIRKRAEAVGAEAGAELLLLACSDAVIDHHLADNLIPLMALYGGKLMTDQITGHIKSNIYVCEKFIECKFSIEGNKIIRI
jgi:RNA 3'-phosphate cyclase